MSKMLFHQLLHGYDNGHRLLAGSLSLNNSALKLVQALSDLPGQGTVPPITGYITGYPVPSLKMYALAKTWPATEMPRPGCVWTHTLLIDFTDLSAISNLSPLSFFHRPEKLDIFSDYSIPLSFEHPAICLSAELPEDGILQISEALYSTPEECVFVNASDSFPVNEAAMIVWLQQWPRLRRNFRFCTWSTSDRSRSKASFDLQFLPFQRNPNIETNKSVAFIDVSNKKITSEPWVQIFQEANTSSRSESLKNFLWRYGSELESGRAAFKPLVLAWNALESKPINIEMVVSSVSQMPPVSGLIKKSVVEVATHAAETNHVASSIIDFLVKNMSFLSDAIDDGEIEIGKIAKAIWNNSPQTIWSFFRSNSKLEVSVAISAVKLMDPQTIIDATADDIELYGLIVRENIKLAESPLIWQAPAPIPQITSWPLRDCKGASNWAIPAMFKAYNPAVADLAIDVFGLAALTMAAEKCSSDFKQEVENAQSWIFAARKFPELLLQLMADGKVKNLKTLEFISTFLDYRFQPSSQKNDGWAVALNLVHPLNTKLSFSFSAYLMARALSKKSPEPSVLIQHCFDSIHSDLMMSKIEYDAWSKLERELPDGHSWQKWDKANLVRLGAAQIFISNKLPLEEFLKITSDKDTYHRLIKVTASLPDGTNYLRALSLDFDISEDDSLFKLEKYVRKVLKIKKHKN